jgi:hypothetical protein
MAQLHAGECFNKEAEMHFLLIVLASMVCVEPVQEAQQASGKLPAPFVIKLSAQQTTFKKGSEIKLKVALTNTSNQQIFVRREKRDDKAEFSYSFDVRDEAGKPAPEAKYKRALKGEQPEGETTVVVSAPGLVPIDPGQSLDEEVIVSKLFDLSVPGKYVIHAERLDDTSNVSVNSNVVTITVEP